MLFCVCTQVLDKRQQNEQMMKHKQIHVKYLSAKPSDVTEELRQSIKKLVRLLIYWTVNSQQQVTIIRHFEVYVNKMNWKLREK